MPVPAPVTDALLLIVTLLVAGAIAGLPLDYLVTAGVRRGASPALRLWRFGLSRRGLNLRGRRYVISHHCDFVLPRCRHSSQAKGSVDREVLRTWGPWLILGVGIGVYLASLTDARGLTLVFAGGVGIYSLYFLFPTLLDKYSFSLLAQGVPRASLATFLGGFSALLGIGGGTPTVITMTLCGRSIVQAVAPLRVWVSPSARRAAWALPDRFNAVDNHRPSRALGFVNLPALLAISVASY